MIYTLTPNPALDLGGNVNQLIPNEKNYVYGETRCPGGNAINVARLLTRLRVPVKATGFLGGSVGSEIRDLLDAERVKHDFVEIEGHTRISVTVSNVSTHQQTRLSFPGPKIRNAEFQLLKNQVAQMSQSSLLVIGGSFPPGFSFSHLNRLVSQARRRKLSVVLDLPGHLLRKVHLEGILFIKPNLIEFQELVGRKITTLPQIVRAARRLADKVGLVCVSSVGKGALLVSRDYACYGTPPLIRTKTTVGAGDSMVAGIVAKLVSFAEKESISCEQMHELLRFGLAAAMATLSVSGTTLGNSKGVNAFYPRIVVKEIKL